MDPNVETLWIEACAHCLHRRWRTVGPVQLEELARELWADQGLRALLPGDAVAKWTEPVETGLLREPSVGQTEPTRSHGY